MLRLYKTSLRLYPKPFRDQYAEQMLITAEDILRHTHSKTGRMFAISRLLSDLLATAVQENSNQIGVIMKRQNQMVITVSMLSLVVLSLKIVAVAFLSFIWLATILGIFSSVLSSNVVDTFAEVIFPLMTLMMLPLALIALRRARISLLDKVVWSFGLGLCGAIAFIAIESIVRLITMHYYPQLMAHDVIIGLIVELVFLMTFYSGVSRSEKRFIRLAPR